jgi:hypothetical protein
MRDTSYTPGIAEAMNSGNGGGAEIVPFTGASLGGLEEMMQPADVPPQILQNFDIAGLTAAGTQLDVVFRDSRPDGFSLISVRLAPDFIVTSHRHDVDCLYYVISGCVMLGRRRLDPGGGFLVLANRAYGYRAGPDGATVLEFRKATSFGTVVTESSPAKWREFADVVGRAGDWR